MKKYIISEHSFFDEEKEIWRTDIGEENKSGPLLYSVYGKSEFHCRRNAHDLVRAMERQNAIDKFPKFQ